MADPTALQCALPFVPKLNATTGQLECVQLEMPPTCLVGEVPQPDAQGRWKCIAAQPSIPPVQVQATVDAPTIPKIWGVAGVALLVLAGAWWMLGREPQPRRVQRNGSVWYVVAWVGSTLYRSYKHKTLAKAKQRAARLEARGMRAVIVRGS